MHGSPRRVLIFISSALLLVALASAACDYGVANPVPTAPSADTNVSNPTPSPPASGAALTYVKDIQPILASDCVVCHGASRHDAGVNLSTYAGVMKNVVAGNANSLLIRVTQPGGLMASQFHGSAAAKAATIKSWIVTYSAAQQ